MDEAEVTLEITNGDSVDKGKRVVGRSVSKVKSIVSSALKSTPAISRKSAKLTDKKIQKGISSSNIITGNDSTARGDAPIQPELNADFLSLLDTNARKIQSWFRTQLVTNHQKAQAKFIKSLKADLFKPTVSSEPIPISCPIQKEEKHDATQSPLLHDTDPEESRTKRREALAKSIRDQIQSEMKDLSTTLLVNLVPLKPDIIPLPEKSADQPSALLYLDYASDFEPVDEAQEMKEISVIEDMVISLDDPRQDFVFPAKVEVANSDYSVQIPDSHTNVEKERLLVSNSNLADIIEFKEQALSAKEIMHHPKSIQLAEPTIEHRLSETQFKKTEKKLEPREDSISSTTNSIKVKNRRKSFSRSCESKPSKHTNFRKEYFDSDQDSSQKFETNTSIEDGYQSEYSSYVEQQSSMTPSSMSRAPYSNPQLVSMMEPTNLANNQLEYAKNCQSSDRTSVADSDTNTHNRIEKILGYLKTVNVQSSSAPSISGNTPKEADGTIESLRQRFSQLTIDLQGKQLECSSQTELIQALKQSHVAELRDLKKEFKAKQSRQQKEYEKVVERHVELAETVIGEKKQLSKDCDRLMTSLADLERKYQEKIAQAQENHAKEMKHQKELVMAAEKTKRDAWIQEKTKLIKEATVKGLEPEIQRMIAQHKLQLHALEDKFKEQLVHEKNNLSEQHHHQMEMMRQRITSERQKAAEEERDFARTRYAQQMERDETEFASSKRKYMTEQETAKSEMNAAFKHELKEKEASYGAEIQALKHEMDRVEQLHRMALDQLRTENTTRLRSVQEQATVDLEKWKTEYMERIESEIKVKEKRFKEKLIKERDDELELVISRLENETDSSQSDVHRKFRMDIEKLKSDHAMEIKQLRDQHSMAVDKIISIQHELESLTESKKELQKQNVNLEYECKSKDKRLQHLQSEVERLSLHESELKKNLYNALEMELQEMRNKNQALSNTILELKNQKISAARSHENQLQQLYKDKEEEFAKVEMEVMRTISNQRESIQHLQEELNIAMYKNASLEKVLEKQRKDLMSF